MAKPYLVGRSSLAARGAVPTIFGARPQFQRDGLFLLDDMRVLGHDAPRFVRGDIVSSPGVSYSWISFPSGVRILASTPGRILPLDPNQISSGVVAHTTVAVSVNPR